MNRSDGYRVVDRGGQRSTQNESQWSGAPNPDGYAIVVD